MINIEEFIIKFSEQFEDTDVQDFTSETVFKDIEEWDSLLSLSVIAMVDEECDVILSGDDIVKSKTIGDLYIVVNIKSN